MFEGSNFRWFTIFKNNNNEFSLLIIKITRYSACTTQLNSRGLAAEMVIVGAVAQPGFVQEGGRIQKKYLII